MVTRVRLLHPMGGWRVIDDICVVVPAGTVGVFCGPWPDPLPARNQGRGTPPKRPDGPWLLIAVDTDDGPVHVPAEAAMFEEAVA